MKRRNLVVTCAVFAAAGASSAFGQCPTLNYTTIALPCQYELDTGNGVNVSGAAPLTYVWQYHNGSAWTNFPSSSGNITVNSNVVGVGYAGNSAGCHFTANFVIGLAMKIDTRCTVSNSCGPLVVTNTAGIRYCMADYSSEWGGCDQLVDHWDYDDFVADFANNEPSTDFNQDATLDYFDYLDFTDAYGAGCP